MGAQDQTDLVYIVDWDIPTEPAWRRAYFYKKLQKLRREYGFEGSLSTASVLIIQDRDFAMAVHALASEYGRSNIYEGRRINGGRR